MGKRALHKKECNFIYTQAKCFVNDTEVQYLLYNVYDKSSLVLYEKDYTTSLWFGFMEPNVAKNDVKPLSMLGEDGDFQRDQSHH
jgi:hypothetical protein